MKKFRVDRSKIHGKGIIATLPIEQGERIGIAIVTRNGIPVVTSDLGVFVNHSGKDNSRLVKNGGDYELIAIRDIAVGEEIVSNYSLAPWFVERPGAHFI